MAGTVMESRNAELALLATAASLPRVAMKRNDLSRGAWRFGVKDMLLFVAGACGALTGIVLFAQVALPTLLILAFVAPMLLFLCFVARRVSPGQPVPLGSCFLMSISAWTVSCVLVMSSMQVPGNSGPIQYSVGSSLASFAFNVRVVTLIAMVLCPIASGLVGAFRLSKGNRLRIGFLSLALGLYLLAWFAIFVDMSFIPMA
jgi:hypothetical protein